MSKPQPQQPQGQPQQQAQPQQQGAAPAASPPDLAHALQQHAQAHGLHLAGVDWAAVGDALNHLILALLRGGGQPQPPTPAP
jgi:predicted component of type VI protein secretion system